MGKIKITHLRIIHRVKFKLKLQVITSYHSHVLTYGYARVDESTRWLTKKLTGLPQPTYQICNGFI